MESNDDDTSEAAVEVVSLVAVVGYISAILSAIFNGSFTSGFKVSHVASCQLHPVWFTVYVSLGVVLSSWLFGWILAPWNDWAVGDNSSTSSKYWDFEPLGLVAGSLFVLSIAFSFAAIDRIGVALSQGLWSGCAILVSFLWGVLAFGDSIPSVWMAILALVLLMGGVGVIAFCESIANKYYNNNNQRNNHYETIQETQQQHANEEVEVSLDDFLAKDETETHNNNNDDDNHHHHWRIGLICALFVGIFGGSILVPLHYVPLHKSGFVFLPSFGCGVLLACPLVALVWLRLLSFTPPMHLYPCLFVGIISGTLWNMSNVLAIIAIPRIGYAIAYPILQCALFVSGLLGIFVFDEITDRSSIGTFFMGGIILLCGAILLSSYPSG